MSKFRFISILLLLLRFSGLAQSNDTSSIRLNEITVTAYKEESAHYSPLNISAINIDSASKYASYNLSELLSKTDGVNMLSTGIGISKPVIRGLYGNRVLVLLNGLRFDNQQWQEEHGLGLSSFGLSRVELIKGPIGILYGAEALGGVINLIEEEKPKELGKETDFSTTLNSNTMGGMLQAGFKTRKKNSWHRVRLGAENNADYSDGKNKRVLNSRFDGYYLKTTFGFERKNWTSVNNYFSSFNRFGFIFNDIYTFVSPDARGSRRMNENPTHLVLLNVLSSENKFMLSERWKLNLNVGVQSNERMENEGGGAISLNMHLMTGQSLTKAEYSINSRNKIILSNLNSFESNRNYGSRKIVPDANMQESNVSLNYEINLGKKLVFENAVGAGEKLIQTFFTPTVNDHGNEIKPFSKLSPYYNFFSGLSYFPNEEFNIKANLASGLRVANLAELSSNGLHEGVFTYEIGDPGFKNETLYSANLFINYRLKFFELSFSPFYNYFLNYIYLQPVNETWFGFPVSRYKQQNATQYGGEASLLVRPSRSLDVKLSYSGMSSKTQDGLFTPYTPAQKLVPALSYRARLKDKVSLSSFTNLEYYLAQNEASPYETKTPEYLIWNAGISASFGRAKKSYLLSLTTNNINNAAYASHLSRLKALGLLNPGRNLIFTFKINL